jgi:hypothetical protein
VHADTYLETVRARLDKAGFQLEAARPGTALKARRREVKLSRFGLVETVVEVSTLDSQPTPEDLRAFGDAAVRSALEGKSRIPRGLGSSLVVYPALVADSISDDLARFATSYAPKHFSIMEFPLVVDPAARSLVMLGKTPPWGAAYYRKTRQDAQELLAPP